MPRPHRSNPKIKHHAFELRKTLTPAERKLWLRIRNDQLGVTFRRQHAVVNYIPDFVCIEKKLIIELDGSQHLEQKEYDNERTNYLESLGYKVIPKGDDVHFWNNDVTNDIDGVILAIINALKDENNMPNKRKNPIPLLDEIEKFYEAQRPKIKPKYPYDSKSDTIHLPPEIIEDLKFILLTGNKVAAVKRVAELSGAGLRVSKDFVDELYRSISR